METTQEQAQGYRYCVAMSGSPAESTAHTPLTAAEMVAQGMESRLNVQGSSIFQQLGRWNLESEPGYVVEVVSSMAALRTVGELLQAYQKHLGMTFFVTCEPVTYMEVF